MAATPVYLQEGYQKYMGYMLQNLSKQECYYIHLIQQYNVIQIIIFNVKLPRSFFLHLCHLHFR